jgi:hypothetical protein
LILIGSFSFRLFCQSPTKLAPEGRNQIAVTYIITQVGYVPRYFLIFASLLALLVTAPAVAADKPSGDNTASYGARLLRFSII